MPEMSESNEDEILLASAVRFLIDGNEQDAASVLLSCTLDIRSSGDTWFVGDETHYAQHVKLTGPRAAYDILNDGNHPICAAIQKAIIAVMPSDTYIKRFSAHAELVTIDQFWRLELLEIARGQGVTNQIAEAGHARIRTWNNLRFRSQSEIEIAKALDRAGVFFLPNCKGRLTTPTGRENKEADFLICQEGKWGILEVDGEPFHPPSRTVHDHARNRLFMAHGVRIVQNYDANECFNESDRVVEEFLVILKRS